jgi:hypothetical protein
MTEQAANKPRRGRALPVAIIVLASVIGFFSIFAVWVKRQALETDTWTRTSAQLLENEDIRDALADYLVTQLYANVDVEKQIASVLPPDLQGLAGPISGGVRQLVDDTARKALAEPKVQQLWENANRAAHEQLLSVIDDKGTAVSTGGGVVTLNLDTILAGVAAEVGLPSSLTSKLPADAAHLEVMRSDELETVQDGAHLLRTLAWLLTAITLGLYALAIYLARGWRREALRSVGIAFVVVGIMVLFAHVLAGRAVVGSLADTSTAEPAVQATWDIATSLLLATGQAVVGYGLVIILAAWLAGPSSWATSLRREITPYYRQPHVAYGALAVLLLLIFWWDPTEATHRLGPSLLLILFVALGFEFMRRQVIREFPDAVVTGSPGEMAQRMAHRMREARERRLASHRAISEPTRVDELEKLAGLHDSGALTDEEFTAEKTRLLEKA